MAAERDFELLDDYLSNRLDQHGRSAFEEMLTRDPALRNELDLQREFINGIRRARIAELKAMLNNVPIPAGQTGGSTLGSKIALWTAIAGAIGVGAYYYFDKDTGEIRTEQTPSRPQPRTESSPPQQPANDPALDSGARQKGQPVDQSPVVATEPASTGEAPIEKPDPVPPRNSTDSAEIPPSEPKVEAFDPTGEHEDDREPDREERETAAPADRPGIAVEVEANHRKYDFHYQFRDGKLFLYGPFESGLYEILEFFSGDQQTVFLLFEEKYYLLSDDKGKLKPLEPIDDPALIKKLKEYRNR